MPEDRSNDNATWPTPKFRFEVDLGTELKRVVFQEVSGMDVESNTIEFRKRDTPHFSETKMPGIVKYGSVTLKRGIFAADNKFWDWHDKISKNEIKKTTMLIKLFDKGGQVVMQWQLQNAWPTKITSANLNSDGNEVAIETIEISHEQLTITK